MIKNLFRTCLSVLAVILGLTAVSFAQTEPGEKFPNVKIGNFGQMDERFYRGAQPLPEDFQSLKDLGINTVIDLRNDPTDYEKSAVEALGMKYINIPMSGWKYPKDSQVEQFMKIANDPATGKFFVHCKAGKHRTGVAGAVYRFENYGWDYDRVFDEMKEYDFSWWIVHGMLKTYVKDYGRKMEAEKARMKDAPDATATVASP